MTAYFVTGAGTDVGKTYLTCALVRHWQQRGLTVNALKPVLSGFAPGDAQSDTHRILTALGRAASPGAIAAMSPWRFAAPLSPDAAARRENRAIQFDELLTFCRDTARIGHDRLLVEGVGGAFVPLTDRHVVADWMGALGLPAILVAGSYLGTLSHTLAAVEALAARRVSVAAIVMSESPESPMPLAETEATLAHFLAPIPVVALPRRSGDDVPPELTRLDRLLA